MSPTHFQDQEKRARGYLRNVAIFALFPAFVSAVLLRYGVEMPGMHWLTLVACTVVLFTLIWWWSTTIPGELGRCTLRALDAEIQLIIHGDPDFQTKIEALSDNDLENRKLRIEWVRRYIPKTNQPAADVDIETIKVEQLRRHIAANRRERESQPRRRPATSILAACNNIPGVQVDEITRIGFIEAIAKHHTVMGYEADTLALCPTDLPMLLSFCRDDMPHALPLNLQPQYFPGCHVLNLECEYALEGVPTHVYRKPATQPLSALMRMTRETEELFEAVREKPPEPEPEGPRLRRFDL